MYQRNDTNQSTLASGNIQSQWNSEFQNRSNTRSRPNQSKKRQNADAAIITGNVTSNDVACLIKLPS